MGFKLGMGETLVKNSQSRVISIEKKRSPQDSNIDKLNRLISEVREKSIDITFNYSEWLEVAFACASLGEDGRECFHELSKNNPEYDYNDTDKKFNNALTKGSGRFTIATLFHKLKQAGLDISNRENSLVNYKPEVEIIKTEKKGFIEPVSITEIEFSFDIWHFENPKNPKLKGLNRNAILKKIQEFGCFKKYRDNGTYFFIREVNNIIEEIEISEIVDSLFGYVEKINACISFDYKGATIILSPEKLKDTFLKQSHLIFNKVFLCHLHTHTKPILKDTKYNSYFLFKSFIISVSKEGIKLKEYESLQDTCIWKDQILEHDFKYNPENNLCHFAKFINNISNGEIDRIEAARTAIGYLLHSFSNPSQGQAIIAYDEEITDLKRPQGGTGKGLFSNSIKQVKRVVKIDGKKFDKNDKFKYQEVTESTQVVWIDDVKPDIGFETFHSCLTDGWSIEKKYQDQFYIKPEDAPKMLICSNSILTGEGTTNKRRQFILEFSNHYSRQIKNGTEQPIIEEHGCLFFDKNDWTKQEWNMFFSYMIDCCVLYFNNGLTAAKPRGIEKNRLLQATSDEFVEWIEAQGFKIKERYLTSQYFNDFKETYYGANSEFKQRGFNNWLKSFAKSNNWKMNSIRSNGEGYFEFQSLSL